MSNGLKRGMFIVLCANLINMIFNLLTNFMLPKYLTVEVYSAIKTYQLYTSYVGIVHLGFIDGMYIKYGGSEMENINLKKLGTNLATFRMFQFIETVFFFIIAIILKDMIFLMFTLSILPMNMATYFKYLYQATGEFKIYGKVLNLTTIITFFVNSILVFLIKSDKELVYLISYVIINIFIWIILEIMIEKKCSYKFGLLWISFKEGVTSIKNGVYLMLGTFSSTLLTSMDRWFVKFFMNTIEFAQYSFAVSVESFLNIAVTPITVTLYNYFCKNHKVERIQFMKRCVMIFAVFIVSVAYLAKFVLEIFLNNYLQSIKVIFILFASQIIYIVLKGVYVNIYKARKQQKRYFCELITIVFLGFTLNFILYFLMGNMESFAWATLISALVWFIVCCIDFKDIPCSWQEISYLFFEIALFIIIGIKFSSLIGFLIYIVVSFFFTIIFMKSTVREIMLKFIKKLSKNNKR